MHLRINVVGSDNLKYQPYKQYDAFSTRDGNAGLLFKASPTLDQLINKEESEVTFGETLTIYQQNIDREGKLINGSDVNGARYMRQNLSTEVGSLFFGHGQALNPADLHPVARDYVLPPTATS